MKFYYLGALVLLYAVSSSILQQLNASEKTDALTNRQKSDHSQKNQGKNDKKPPKLTVVFVPDGVPNAAINKIAKYLKGGLKFLRNRGIVYSNVFHPHANCSTAQGHAAFLTGTFPAYHGMVNNEWLDSNGQLFGAQQDNDLATSAVFDPTNGKIYNVDEFSPLISSIYPAGVSPRNYLVDTVSDQAVIFSNPNQKTKVYSICSSNEVAVLMAGRLGKAIWMDGVSGLFTTSKYYYPNGIPQWVNKFNQDHPVPPTVTWRPVYKVGSPAYDFPDAQNYEFSVVLAPPYLPITVIPPNRTLFNETINSFDPILGAETYIESPTGIHTLFQFAKKLIKTHLSKNPESNLVLWMNSDCFDLFGNGLGVQTQESIDLIYHFDRELAELMKFIYKRLSPEECLFVCIADEGTLPSIPELLDQQGFDLAKRTIGDSNGLPVPSLVTQFNAALGNDYVQLINPPFLYLNLPIYNLLNPIQKEELLQEIKILLREVPGVKDAWTIDEILALPFEKEDPARFFKLHAFKNNPNTTPPQERRSGEIIFQSLPFNLITGNIEDNPQPIHGQNHISCYGYDAQVPLYIYQKGRFEKMIINKPVMTQQLAVTLSEILHIPRPSAASVNIKPLPRVCTFFGPLG